MTKLAEGLESCLVSYFVSPSSGLEVVIKACSNKQVLEPGPEIEQGTANLARELNKSMNVNDFRLMTRAEMEDYKRREQEGDDVEEYHEMSELQ